MEDPMIVPIAGACLATANFLLASAGVNLNSVAVTCKVIKNITQPVVFGIPVHFYMDIAIELFQRQRWKDQTSLFFINLIIEQLYVPHKGKSFN